MTLAIERSIIGGVFRLLIGGMQGSMSLSARASRNQLLS